VRGGDLRLKVKTGRGITKITIGIAGLIESWVGITGLRNPVGGPLEHDKASRTLVTLKSSLCCYYSRYLTG